MSQYVYCYQFGSGDCYKIGKTKHPPEKRKRGIATGSPVDIKPYRTVETDDASTLETYVHHLLRAKRGRGEFFSVSRRELDDAVDQAVVFVNELQPLRRKAKNLRRIKPNETMLGPSDEMRQAALQFEEAKNEYWLLEKRIELLQSRIQVAIGENRGIEAVASWKWKPHPEMNTKRFRRDHPKLYEEYLEDLGRRELHIELQSVDAPELAYGRASAGE